MTDFNINNWRSKHVLKEGVGGVVSRNPFGKMTGMFRTETVDHIDDKEAATDYDDLEDKDLDNDGDQDASDSYLHKRQGTVAKKDESHESGHEDLEENELEELSDEEFNIQEWQKKFLDKRNLKWG